MKAKKAIKRLDSVEVLLSDVIDQYNNVDGVRELLDTAKEAVFSAKAKVNSERNKSSSAKKKGAAVEKKSVRGVTAAREAKSA